MARKHPKDRISFRVNVVIHNTIGDEFDALYPPDSDKRAELNLSSHLRPLIEQKFRELIRDEQDRMRLVSQRPVGRAGAMSPVPRIPGIPAVPKLGGR